MLKKILSLFIIVVVVVSAEIYTFAYNNPFAYNPYNYPYVPTGICKIVEINLKTKTVTIIQEKKNNRSFTRTFTFKNDLVVDVGGEKKTIADIKVGDIVTIEYVKYNNVEILQKISRELTSEEQEEKRKEINKRYNEFVKKNSVEEWPNISELTANPFVYEGKIVALQAHFETMQTATQGIFGVGNAPVIVSDIPKGMFKEEGLIVVLAGKVIGKTELQVPLLGLMQVPHLKFVGVHFCQDNNCNDIIPK